MRRSVKAATLMLPLLLLLLGVSPGLAQAQSGPPVILHFRGAEVPALAAVDRTNQPIRLAELRGRIVIVNLWATWCPLCREEMPSLERLAARYPDDLTVLAISNDADGWPAVDRFWGQHFPHLRAALAAGPELMQFGALGLPYSLIVGRDGREIGRVPRSVEWDQGEMLAFVARSISSK